MKRTYSMLRLKRIFKIRRIILPFIIGTVCIETLVFLHTNYKLFLGKIQTDIMSQKNKANSTLLQPHKKIKSNIFFPDGKDEDQRIQKRRDFVKKMMIHAWKNYKKYAWGENELDTAARAKYSNSIMGKFPMGATIVDALDTLYIMGLHKEFAEGKEWIKNNLNFNNVTDYVSVFETNIRYIGGLLSVYSFTGDDLFKEKAVHIANKLLPAFNTETGIPYSLVNMSSGDSKNYVWVYQQQSILSEIGTLHMEFSYLSDITGNSIYREKVQKVRDILDKKKKINGLYNNFISPHTGNWGVFDVSIGSQGDSYYEYLLKEWIRSGFTDEQPHRMFKEAIVHLKNKLVRRSNVDLTYFGEYRENVFFQRMQHLACFSGGLFALYSVVDKTENSTLWLTLGENITKTCRVSYKLAATKLGPEQFSFNDEKDAVSSEIDQKFYALRPETVESYFVMWRLTNEEKYRKWGWDVVIALNKHCKVSAGYSGILDVYDSKSDKNFVQSSYFLAETLKYLYLLFSKNDLLSLNKWVFNTEAHPLPIRHYNSWYRESASVKKMK